MLDRRDTGAHVCAGDHHIRKEPWSDAAIIHGRRCQTEGHGGANDNSAATRTPFAWNWRGRPLDAYMRGTRLHVFVLCMHICTSCGTIPLEDHLSTTAKLRGR